MSNSKFRNSSDTDTFGSRFEQIDDDTRVAHRTIKTDGEVEDAIAKMQSKFAALDPATLEGVLVVIVPKADADGNSELNAEVGGSTQARKHMLAGILEMFQQATARDRN